MPACDVVSYLKHGANERSFINGLLANKKNNKFKHTFLVITRCKKKAKHHMMVK